MNIIEKKKRQMGQGGFTLIELLVVIAILAVLAGLAVIGIGAMRDNADKQACKADADTYQTAIEAAKIASNGTAYPAAATQTAINSLGGSTYVNRSSKYENKWSYTAATGQIDSSGC